MTGYKKILRLARLPLAMVVAILTLAIMARATQTITTPNASFISYTLAPGANSAAITPVSNQSVLVMGVTNTSNYKGTGHVTLLRVPSNALVWAGQESSTPAALTSGFSAVAGTHIVYLDSAHTIDIQVNTADTFGIHSANLAGVTLTGNVTMIW